MARFLAPGTVVNGHEVGKLLGTGGEGHVYLATDPRGREVVLKQHKESASDPRWETEIERVKRLDRLIGQTHENVCEVYDVFEHEDLMYVAMARVSGESLESLMMSGPLSPSKLAPILLDILAGLGFLHALEIVHRDVKPGNIIVTTAASGRTCAKLIDLGIALHLGLTRLTRRDFGAGTYEYAPLEIIFAKDSEIDGRADLHSVGATAFHALTGSLPFGEFADDALLERLADPARPSARALNPAVPEPVNQYLQRLMAFRVADRPNLADQAREELETILRTLPPGALDTDAGTGSPVADRRPRVLLVESGTLAGTSIPVPKGGITLGRQRLNPEDGLISRSHFRAKPTREGVLLRDVGSSNGLIMGAKRLRKVWLPSGATIAVGSTTLKCV